MWAKHSPRITAYIEITAPTAVGELRFPDAASEESEETWVSQATAVIRLR
jgi:hypothetical protein